MSVERPKLRHIEAFPIQQGKQTLICLRDPLRYTDKIITVSPVAVSMLQCFDGEHTLAEIQAAFTATTRQLLPLEQLQGVIGKLDEALLLDSPRFDAHRATLIREFHESPVREASHAGASYPEKPTEIAGMFEKHFESPRGPGKDGRKREHPPVAIVSPHIDLRRGGPGFAWAYGQIADASKVDIFVILGVAHSPTKHRFAGTKKNFKTPMGTAMTNNVFMDLLAKKLPFDLFEDEFAHRSEHSVEFQVVYLQYALGKQHEFQIVPILVGSFHDLVEDGKEPMQDPEVAAFAKALRETMAETGKHVCVIAGVDLAHVGGRFGDEFTVNKEVLTQLEADDREMLKTLERCDAREFFEFIHEEKDCRRVCGFPTLYTMLSSLDLIQGELLYYDQSFEEDTNSVVSFASMSFH